MMLKKLLTLCTAVLLSSSMLTSVQAAPEYDNPKARPPIHLDDANLDAVTQLDQLNDLPAPEVGYYDMVPDFTTNLATSGSGKLHYLRVHVNIMVKDANDIDLVTTHDPLIRDVVLNTIGSKEYGAISTAAGREVLRAACRSRVASLLEEKKGSPVVQDLLFTNYVYQ